MTNHTVSLPISAFESGDKTWYECYTIKTHPKCHTFQVPAVNNNIGDAQNCEVETTISDN
jgi:hypothetical protein